ncbi:hypothetical protein FCH79_15690 [Pseudomonas koreensis]|nr:hypothetical protein [Pseudomonas koreensis]
MAGLTLSLASQLPQVIWPTMDLWSLPSTVGAGLPAKAVDQAIWMLIVPTPSRAGSLPHLIGVEHRDCVHLRSTVGAGLPAMGPVASALNNVQTVTIWPVP